MDRLLSRRQGPYAPILSMRTLGREGDYIVGLMVHPYIRMSRENTEGGYPHDNNWRDIPVCWFDGVDVWEQPDDGYINAVEGVWVDIARIVPAGRHTLLALGPKVLAVDEKGETHEVRG